jgi:hypothetical protein
MGLGPLSDRMGLFIAVTSYNGKISFSATSCRRTMPDVEFFMDCVRDSFAELGAASSTAKPKSSKTAVVKTVSKKASTKKASSKKKITRKKASKKVVKKSTTKAYKSTS